MKSGLLYKKTGKPYGMSENDLELALVEKSQGYRGTVLKKTIQRRRAQLKELSPYAIKAFEEKMVSYYKELNNKWRRMNTQERAPYYISARISGYRRVREEMLNNISRRAQNNANEARKIAEKIRSENARMKALKEKTELKIQKIERNKRYNEFTKLNKRRCEKLALNRKRIEKVNAALYREAKERTKIMNKERKNLQCKKTKKSNSNNICRLKQKAKLPKKSKSSSVPKKIVIKTKITDKNNLSLKNKPNKAKKQINKSVIRVSKVKSSKKQINKKHDSNNSLKKTAVNKKKPKTASRNSSNINKLRYILQPTPTKRQREARLKAELKEENRLNEEVVKLVMARPNANMNNLCKITMDRHKEKKTKKHVTSNSCRRAVKISGLGDCSGEIKTIASSHDTKNRSNMQLRKRERRH